jgi:type IV pilus assembly protein PilM
MKLPEFFGIDIGQNTVKVVQLDRKDKKSKLKKAFSFETGNGSLVTDDNIARADLASRIKDAVTNAKMNTKKCVVALPEPIVFNRLLTFPQLEEKALNDAIHWNAKQYIPIPVDEVQMDWIKVADIDAQGKKMIQLLLVAAPKKVINYTQEIFRNAELELIAIETESVATSRVISYTYGQKGSSLVLDVGSAGTDLSVVSDSKLIFSQSLGTGSEAMTQAISGAFSIDAVQAEQYKIKFGLNQNQGDGKIFNALQPVVNIIIGEVNKTINFFRSKYQQSTPNKIIILGEGGKVPGLAEYLSKQLGIQTEVANLLKNIEAGGDLKKQVDSLGGMPGYGVAFGLALKTE